MTVRIVHKNSVAQDKRPTASQLANGEIAVNLHEGGAFLSVKDTAGNIQQVGGVKVSSQSPLDPVLGTLWVDSDKDKLFVFDGSLWRGVSGSGSGGGGSVNIIGGAGIDAVDSGSTVTLSVDAGTAINLIGDTVNVTAGQGITTAANDVSVDPGAGIDLSGGVVNVTEGEGIHIKSDAVSVEIQSDAVTTGLQLTGSGNDKVLQVKAASQDQLGSVRVDGSTITVDNAGVISAVLPDPIVYKGNINPTTRSSGPQPNPGGSPGDAYTVSWGDPNTEGTLSSPWPNLIKGDDTTATLGDLLIINSGDGTANNSWTLVKTGTVDNSASISVGDGQTNAYPPASPKEGDVWYNLDDGRTYVLIQDGGGQNEWVDVSPQGNQMLWKSDTAGIIEPQTNTDALKIPKLASNSTAGTRIAMVDATQTFVANEVGDGLQIDGGVLKVRTSGSGSKVLDLQFVTDNGNTTDNAIKSEVGVGVGNYPSGNGVNILPGSVTIRRDSGQAIELYKGGTAVSNRTVQINSDGKSTFGPQNASCFFNVSADLGAGNSAIIENTNSNGYGVRFSGGGASATEYVADFRKQDGTSVLKANGDGNVDIPNRADIGTNSLADYAAIFANKSDTQATIVVTNAGGGESFLSQADTDQIAIQVNDKKTSTSETVVIYGNGSASFAKFVSAGGNGTNVDGLAAHTSSQLPSQASCQVKNSGADASKALLFLGRGAGNTNQVEIWADGSASFAGDVTIGETTGSSAVNKGGCFFDAEGSIYLMHKDTETSDYLRCDQFDGNTRAKISSSGTYTAGTPGAGGELGPGVVVSALAGSLATYKNILTDSATDTSQTNHHLICYASNNPDPENSPQDRTKVFAVTAAGSVHSEGSATFVGTVTDDTSDIKFKKNVKDAPTQAQLDDIKELKLRTWQWREGAWGAASRKARHQMGLVAQEAERVDPNLAYTVNQGEEDSFKAIDHKVLTMKLLGALQEATTRIEALEAEVAQLKGGSN